MSAPESVESGAHSGLFSSLRSFWSVLLAILYTRLDLATAELEEEAIRAVRLLLVGLAGLLSVGLTLFFLMFFLVALFWNTPYRLPVLGGICGVSLLASLILVLATRHLFHNRPKFLSQTLTELRRDVEGLRAATVKTGETKP